MDRRPRTNCLWQIGQRFSLVMAAIAVMDLLQKGKGPRCGPGTSWDALFSFQRQRVRSAPQYLWQLGDVCHDTPSFIAGEKLGRGSPAGLVLAIDVAQRLSVTVLDDEAGGRLFDRPRWREAASCWDAPSCSSRQRWSLVTDAAPWRWPPMR